MLIAVFAFPILVKLVRLAILALYYRQFIEDTRHITVAFNALKAVDYRNSAYMKVEWALQICDNTLVPFCLPYRVLSTPLMLDTALRCSYGSYTKRVHSRRQMPSARA